MSNQESNSASGNRLIFPDWMTDKNYKHETSSGISDVQISALWTPSERMQIAKLIAASSRKLITERGHDPLIRDEAMHRLFIVDWVLDMPAEWLENNRRIIMDKAGILERSGGTEPL